MLAANDPKLFTDPVSLSYSDLNVSRGAASKSLLLAVSDAGGGAGAWTIEVRPQSQPSGVEIVVPGSITLAPGGDLQVLGHGSSRGRLRARRGVRVPAPAPRRRHPEGGVRDARDAARIGAGADRAAGPVPDGRHAQGRLARLRLPLPGRRVRPGAELRRRAGERGRRGDALPDPARRARGQRRRGRDRLVAGLARAPVGPRLAGRERRSGIRRHARERQQPDGRLSRSTSAPQRRSSRARRPTTCRSTPAGTSSRAARWAGRTSSAPGWTTCSRRCSA